MSQDEIIRAMRNLGGRDLTSRQIQQEFVRIHFETGLYDNILSHKKKTNHTAFCYGLKRLINNESVTRRLVRTESGLKRCSGSMRFVYSLQEQNNQ